jgi:FtsZ-binding cell division protein ZapB
MELSLFNGSTLNIIIGFMVVALTLVALFSGSTPVKWLASLFAIFGIGYLYKNLRPGNDIAKEFKKNQKSVEQFKKDRNVAMKVISENQGKIEELKKEKETLKQADQSDINKIEEIDADIELLHSSNEQIDRSVAARKDRIQDLLSQVITDENSNSAETGSTLAVSGFKLKGDVE